MSKKLVTFTEDGPVPALQRGETLVCAGCKHEYGPAEALDLWDSSYAAAVCPSCNKFGSFYRRKVKAPNRTAAGRWGEEVAAHGFSIVPTTLISHLGVLKLSPAGVVVLLHLERYRRSADEAVWPSIRRIARQAGLSERTVRKHVGDLERRGLIEVREAHRKEGGFTSSRYTAAGLREALKLLAQNEIAGRSVEDGLDDLLAGLARRGEAAHAARRAGRMPADVIPLRGRSAKSA